MNMISYFVDNILRFFILRIKKITFSISLSYFVTNKAIFHFESYQYEIYFKITKHQNEMINKQFRFTQSARDKFRFAKHKAYLRCVIKHPINCDVLCHFDLAVNSMAIRVVEFSNGGYKIRKVIA